MTLLRFLHQELLINSLSRHPKVYFNIIRKKHHHLALNLWGDLKSDMSALVSIFSVSRVGRRTDILVPEVAWTTRAEARKADGFRRRMKCVVQHSVHLRTSFRPPIRRSDGHKADAAAFSASAAAICSLAPTISNCHCDLEF